MSSTVLSPSELEAYRRDGYLILRAFFTKEKIDPLRGAGRLELEYSLRRGSQKTWWGNRRVLNTDEVS